MKAMILGAGIGSRLDPLTRSLPKPLVPIVGKPVMGHLLDLLARHGVPDVIREKGGVPRRDDAFRPWRNAGAAGTACRCAALVSLSGTSLAHSPGIPPHRLEAGNP